MGDVVTNEVEARVFCKDNKEQDFKLLAKEYPSYPIVWVAYAKYCHSTLHDVTKARRILSSVCPTLRALEIWICLLELEVETSNDNFSKYSILKSAVEDVGWDPRSLPLWDSFFALFVSLHNQTVKSLAVAHGKAATGVAVPSTSSTAPLASIEATNKSFLERQAPDDDISRFFTTIDTADLLTSKAQTFKEALLRHPWRHEQVLEDPSAMVNENRLRELSAKGDLNLEVFQQYLRRFAITPFLNAPPNLWRSVATVIPEAMKTQLEPCAINIQRISSIVFQGITPSIFCRPSSPLTPELDVTALGYWESLLTKEAQDCWGIAQIDAEFWKSRMEFLYHIGCRNLRYLPTLWFGRAQFKFKQSLVEEGISILETVASEKVILGDSLPMILSDAWELVANDLPKAATVLSSAIAHTLATQGTLTSSLIYTGLLKRARLRGMTAWANSVRALLVDGELKPFLSEDLFCALISLAFYENQEPSLISELIQKALDRFPLSVPLRFMQTMPLTSLPKPPNFEDALISLSNADGTIAVTQEALIITKRACQHYHLFGTSSQVTKKWFQRLHELSSLELGSSYRVACRVPDRLGHLYTCDYFESFRHYDAFSMDLGSVGLVGYLLPPSQHRVILPPGSLPPEQIALLVRGSQRTKQLLEIVQGVAPAAEREFLEDTGSASEKTMILQKVLLRTMERARSRRVVSPQQMEQLQLILDDPAVARALHRWFETTA
eukprot:Gregarina_sp_Poly_1__2539@NODE_168_length_12074_cov_98_169901_g149_i0_p2_GENE_NODE_168_length_12074_cov_98_169901_g149_i0NODE_168_length_12074_cov_98_169901_g149_i0_p2_ORF_typecomplete_len725_score84_44Suf/PF05843_14/0_018Suf/PF05843_14/9e03_NODE_168_length_12074_cov_98_169901_g149_i0825010424